MAAQKNVTNANNSSADSGAENSTTKTIPHSVFASLAQYDAKTGALDIKKSAAQFTAALEDWDKRNASVRPTVIEILKVHDKMGANYLIPFVMAKLNLSPLDSENRDMVEAAVDGLVKSGEVYYIQNESGRGRGQGYTLQAPKPEETETTV